MRAAKGSIATAMPYPPSHTTIKLHTIPGGNSPRAAQQPAGLLSLLACGPRLRSCSKSLTSYIYLTRKQKLNSGYNPLYTQGTRSGPQGCSPSVLAVSSLVPVVYSGPWLLRAPNQSTKTVYCNACNFSVTVVKRNIYGTMCSAPSILVGNAIVFSMLIHSINGKG